jgi:drug/metabolite transporter (DMT)-like permease
VRNDVPTLSRQPLTAGSVVLALVCAALWAGQSVAVKVAVDRLPPYRVVTIRLAAAALFLLLIAVVRGTDLRLSRRQAAWVGGNAAFLLVQLGLYTLGTGWTNSVHSIVLINTFPLFAALACHWFLPGFPLDWRSTAGLTAALVGVVVVVSGRPGDAERVGHWHGDLVVLASAAVMGLKTAYAKAVLGEVRPLPAVLWTAVFALPACLAVSLLFEGPQWPRRAETWAALVYQGLAVSGLAFLLWNVVLSRHAPNDVTVFRMLTPPLGIVLGWAVLGDLLTWRVWVGGGLVAAATVFVSRRPPTSLAVSRTRETASEKTTP